MIKGFNRLYSIIFLAILLFASSGEHVFCQARQTIDYDEGIKLAIKLAIEGNYDASRLVCHRILKDVPQYTDAYFIIGNTYAWEERFELAKLFYYKVFEYQNGNLPSFLQLITIALWEADANGALEIANKALKHHPYNHDILLKKAEAFIMIGDFFNAKKVYYLILSDDPNNDDARNGYWSIINGVPEEVEINKRFVLKLSPVDSIFKRAQNFAWMQRFTESREYISKILDAQPDYLPAYVLLAQTYAWQNEYEKARAIINSLNLEKNRYREGIDLAIDIELWSEEYDDAIIKVDSLGLKFFPGDKELLLKKAEIYKASGNLYKSKEIVFKMLTHDSHDTQAIQFFNELRNEGLKDRKRYPDVIALNTKKRGIDTEAMMEEARELVKLGNYSEAQDICVQVLNLSPGDYEAIFLLGSTYAWSGRYDEARQRYETLMKTSFDSHELISALVDVDTWDHSYASALISVNYGLEIYPNDKNFLIKKATIYERSGKSELATEILNHLMAAYPEDVELRKSYYSLKGLVTLNGIGGEFFVNTYNLPAKRTWQMYSAKYFKSNDLGTLIGTVNMGLISSDTISDFLNRSGVQFEVSAYPVFNDKKRYFLINYGFSPSRLFAKHRLGAHIYQEFALTWEFTGGFNYNRYGDSTNITNIMILQTGITKYWKSVSCGFLMNFVPSSQKLARGYTLIGRILLGRPDNWIQIAASAGAYPENPVFYLNDLSLTPSGLLNSYTVYSSLRYMINTQWIGQVTLGFSKQEYMANTLRNDFTLNLGLTYLLKPAD